MSRSHDYDVIVIGAGFAGAVAARDLRAEGRSVLILEARDRVGGRTWTKRFTGTEVEVEFGGAFVVPLAQPSLSAELERYGIGTELHPEPETYSWDLCGEVSTGFPIPMEEIVEFEHTLYELIQNSHRISVGEPLASDLADLDVSLIEFLERVGAGPKAKAFIGAFGDLGSGSRAEEISAVTLFCELAAMGNSPISLFSAGSEKIAGGTRALVEAILADADADLRLESPVRSIEADDSGVVVTSSLGDTFTAATAIVAIPTNCWEDIEFSPPLSEPKQLLATEKHLGRARKVWALIEGAPDTFALGRHPDSLTALVPGAILPNGTLYAGFHVDQAADLEDLSNVERLVQRHLPGAKVLAVDSHDWNTDPYSKGAQCAHRAGRAIQFIDVVGDGQGRLSFAGTDVCNGAWQGWIDGAIESGVRAASRATRLLSDVDIATSRD